MDNSQKLSKGFFVSLETGVFLVSNCHEFIDSNTYTPSFSEHVLPANDRREQWKKIKVAGVDQRLCSVYSNAEEYLKELES